MGPTLTSSDANGSHLTQSGLDKLNLGMLLLEFVSNSLVQWDRGSFNSYEWLLLFQRTGVQFPTPI